MVSKTLSIQNKIGLHARPASLLAMTAKDFESTVTLQKGEKSSVVSGAISVMRLQCKFGDEVTVICDGPDEQACLDAVEQLILSKFGED